MVVRCKGCNHLNSPRRSESQCGKWGRKLYYCKHPNADKLSSKMSNYGTSFIGYGEANCFFSELVLKTSPKWCPKKHESIFDEKQRKGVL